jgi:hypothetical protein
VVGAVAFGLKVEEEALGEVVFVFDYDDECGGFSHVSSRVIFRCGLCGALGLASVIRRHTPGAKAHLFLSIERPKAKALGYLEAKA